MTELNKLTKLLGEDNTELTAYMSAKQKNDRCGGLSSLIAAMERSFAVLQTVVSRQHRALKEALEQSPENTKIKHQKRLAEKIMDDWNFYYY